MENEPQNNRSNRGLKIATAISIIIIIAVVIFCIVVPAKNNTKNNGTNGNVVADDSTSAPKIFQASMSDISGNWTNGLFQSTFTFIPSCNIDGLAFRFKIYDDDYKLINTVDKKIGDVRKGQQYEVKLTIDEFWAGSQVETTVLQGTKTIF